MENFGLFLGNVANQWVFLMGGVAGVILAIVGELKKKPWKNGFWFASLICLIASCDRAWQDEHRNTQAVISEKAAIAALYEDCHSRAKVDEAYTKGLEQSGLNQRTSIDDLQKSASKTQNTINNCVLNLGKMNPIIRDKITVLTVDLLPFAPGNAKGFVFVVTTSEPRSGFHGYLKCSSPFEASEGPFMSTSTSTAMSSGPPIKLSDREYELKVSIPGLDWSPNSPAFMKAYSTGGGPTDCEFKPV